MQIVTKKTVAALKRIDERGGQVNWDALARRFNFTLSGIVSHDVDLSVFSRLVEFVRSAADESRFECELKAIVFFPLILKTGGYQRANFTRHKRSARGYFVGRNIEHRTWMSSKTKCRISLAAENLQASVVEIPDHHLSPPSKLALLSMIEWAASRCA
jgi:hypothetical protein